MLTRLEAETQFYAIADKRPLPSNYGKTINFNRYVNLGALTTPLTEGSVPVAQTLQSTGVSAVVAQYGGYVSVSDLLQIEAVSDVQANAMKVLDYQARLSIDTIIRNTVNTNGTIVYANGKTSLNNLAATDVFNAAEVRKMENDLARANVLPMSDGSYVCISHPQGFYDLKSDTSTGGWLTSNQYKNPEKIFSGEFGKLYNVRFISSTNAYTTANATPVNCYYNYFFGMEGLAVTDLAQQNLRTFAKKAGSAGSMDPLDQINTVGWKVTFVPVVLDAIRCYINVAGSSM